MINNLITFSGEERNYDPIAILKIGIPKEGYSSKQQEEIFSSVKEQVGKFYLPVIVPKDIELEIIDCI